MDTNFDVNKVFQDRLATSMGLDKYQYIMDQVRKTNIATDAVFQRTFNGFYIVRRNETWRKVYYELFEKVKTETPTFESSAEAETHNETVEIGFAVDHAPCVAKVEEFLFGVSREVFGEEVLV